MHATPPTLNVLERRLVLLDVLEALNGGVELASPQKSLHFQHVLTLPLCTFGTPKCAAWSQETTALLPMIAFCVNKGSYTPIHALA